MSASQHTHQFEILGLPAGQFSDESGQFSRTRDFTPVVFIGGLLLSWLACLAGLLFIDQTAVRISAALSDFSNMLPAGLEFHAPATSELVVKITHKLLSITTGAVPVMLLEAYVVGFAKSSLGRLTLNRSVSSTTDFGIFMISALGLVQVWKAVGTLGVAYLLGLGGNELISTLTGHQLQVDTGFAALNFVIYLMAFTFFDYWCHRFFHTDPFWCLHRMHHAGTEMTTVSAVRDHPGTSLFEPIFKLWPVAFFAAPPAYILVFAYALMFYEFLIHSNVPWTWGWFGRWILVPPAGHRLHHSIDSKNSGKLLAILPVWDRMFGTWCPITPADINAPVGVSEGHYNSGNVFRELGHDFAEFAQRTAKIVGLRISTRPGTVEPSVD